MVGGCGVSVMGKGEREGKRGSWGKEEDRMKIKVKKRKREEKHTVNSKHTQSTSNTGGGGDWGDGWIKRHAEKGLEDRKLFARRSQNRRLIISSLNLIFLQHSSLGRERRNERNLIKN